MYMILNWLAKQNIDLIWKVLMKDVDLGEPTSFVDHICLVVLNWNVKQAKILWTVTGICLNPKSLLELQKSNHSEKLGFMVL